MNWAQLIAALAACGGLRTAAAVDTALREAAAAPERDFRQLIDVVRAAISEQINNGRLPEQRRYIGLSAIYSDRAVIELDGKHFTPQVKVGDQVKRGDTLVDVDWEASKAAGYEIVTPMVVSNAAAYAEVEEKASGSVVRGDLALIVEPAEAAAVTA